MCGHHKITGVVASMLTLFLLISWIPLFAAELSSQDIRDLAGKLGAQSFAEREQAKRELWNLGTRARPALLDAVNSPDPEISMRARNLLRKLNCGILPDTPEELAKKLLDFDSLDDAEKQNLISEIIDSGEESWKTLQTLLEVHITTPYSCLSYVGPVSQNIDFLLTLLADKPRWENLLDALFISVDIERESYGRHFLLWSYFFGDLEENISKLEELSARHPEVSHLHSILATLYIKLGRLEQARESAEKAAFPKQLLRIYISLGDYAAASRVVDKAAEALSEPLMVCAIALKCTLQRLSGDYEGYRRNVNKLIEVADNAYYYSRALRVLLFNEDIKTAKELIPNASDQSIEAFVFYPPCYIELNEAVIKEDGKARLPYIEFLSLHGEKDRALRLLDAHFEEIGKKASVYYLGNMIRTARNIGYLQEKVNLTIADALQGQIEPYIPNASHNNFDGILFFRGFGDKDMLWYYLRTKYREKSRAEIFPEFIELLDSIHSDNQLRELQLDLEEFVSTLPQEEQDEWYWDWLEYYTDTGQDDERLEMLLKLAELDKDAENFCNLGELYAGREQWQSAAQWYARAVEDTPDCAVANYMLGYALAMIGDKDAGAEQIHRAKLIMSVYWPYSVPTSVSNICAFRLAEALEALSMNDKSREYFKLFLFSEYRNSWFPLNAYRALIRLDEENSAADLNRKSIYVLNSIILSMFSLITRDVRDLIFFPYQFRLFRAEALMKESAYRQAEEEYTRAFALYYDDIDVIIRVITGFEEAGQQDAADNIYLMVKSKLHACLEVLPSSLIYRNSLAWLMARTSRDLEQALELIKEAVAGDPVNSQYFLTRFHIVDKVLSENPGFLETAFENNLMPTPYDTYSDKIYCKYLEKYIELLKSGEDAPDIQDNQTYKWNTARWIYRGATLAAWTEYTAELYERLADDLEELDRIYPENIRKMVNRGFRHVEALRAIRELVDDPDALDSYKSYTFGDVPLKGMREALEAIASEMPDKQPSDIDFKWLLRYIAESGARADMDRQNTYIGGFDGELFWPAHIVHLRSPRLAVVDGDGVIRFLIVPKRRDHPIRLFNGIAVFTIMYDEEGELEDYSISVVHPVNRQVVDYISSQFFPGSGKIFTEEELDRFFLPFRYRLTNENNNQ